MEGLTELQTSEHVAVQGLFTIDKKPLLDVVTPQRAHFVGNTPCNLNVAVVNFEASEDDCKADPEEFISCEILALINKHVVRQVHYERYEEAEEQAFRLKVSAILIVGEKFTNQILRKMASIELERSDVGNPDTSQLILRLDMTSRIIANAIEGAVKTAVEEYLRRATMGTKIQNATIGYPMKVANPLFGQMTSSDTDFIATGFATNILYHLAAFLAATTLVSDRSKHLAIRDYLVGVRLIEVVLSQMVIYGILIVLETIIIFSTISTIRNIPIKETALCLILTMLLQIWCGLCFGFLVANLTNTSVQAGFIIFSFFP